MVDHLGFLEPEVIEIEEQCEYLRETATFLPAFGTIFDSFWTLSGMKSSFSRIHLYITYPPYRGKMGVGHI